MAKSKHDQIRNLICSHARFKDSWEKDNPYSATPFISPRGKRCTFHEYQTAVNQHFDRTVKKIRALYGDTSRRFARIGWQIFDRELGPDAPPVYRTV